MPDEGAIVNLVDLLVMSIFAICGLCRALSVPKRTPGTATVEHEQLQLRWSYAYIVTILTRVRLSSDYPRIMSRPTHGGAAPRRSTPGRNGTRDTLPCHVFYVSSQLSLVLIQGNDVLQARRRHVEMQRH